MLVHRSSVFRRVRFLFSCHISEPGLRDGAMIMGGNCLFLVLGALFRKDEVVDLQHLPAGSWSCFPAE